MNIENGCLNSVLTRCTKSSTSSSACRIIVVVVIVEVCFLTAASLKCTTKRLVLLPMSVRIAILLGTLKFSFDYCILQVVELHFNAFNFSIGEFGCNTKAA